MTTQHYSNNILTMLMSTILLLAAIGTSWGFSDTFQNIIRHHLHHLVVKVSAPPGLEWTSRRRPLTLLEMAKTKEKTKTKKISDDDTDTTTAVSDDGTNATTTTTTNTTTTTTTTDLQSLLMSRRTINDFEPKLPKDWEAHIRNAIEAATFAPNHKRTEPWRFHLLGKKSIRNVCQLNSKLVTAQKGKAAGKKKLDRWLAIPGWLVVTCVSNNNNDDDDDDDDDKSSSLSSSSMDQPDSLAREDYAACCCAIQNLCLSLHANGIGTKWTTGPVNFDDQFRKAAGGIPSNEYVVGTIWFGTPVNIPKPPSKKLSVDAVLSKHK